MRELVIKEIRARVDAQDRRPMRNLVTIIPHPNYNDMSDEDLLKMLVGLVYRVSQAMEK